MEAKPRRVQFLISGLHPILFTSDVDQYFICNICWLVVRHPVSCNDCEELYCSQCVSEHYSVNQTKCLNCKNQISPKSLRRYPLEVYRNFTLYCENFNNGCRFEGSVQEVQDHKPECDFDVLCCCNPICNRNFLKKDSLFPEHQVCSGKCLEVLGLWNMLGTKPPVEYAEYFKQCLDCHRQKLIESIEHEAAELESKSQETIREMQTKMQSIGDEIEEIKYHIHTGKFKGEKWSCCGDSKHSKGCTKL